MQFLFSPILGAGLGPLAAADPSSSSRIFGSGLDYFGLAHRAHALISSSPTTINGLSSRTNMTAASTYIADITPPEKRAAGFGIIGAASGSGSSSGRSSAGFWVTSTSTTPSTPRAS